MAVVVAGGGITGLAAAWELARAGIAVELYEASERFGGKIRTEHVDGFLLEDGPDSFISYRPAATMLARELGLAVEIIGTSDPRVVHIRTGGRFVPLPEGIGLVLPTRLAPFLATELFSPLEKLAMARDLLLPRSPAGDDVSIGWFLRRRLGRALVARLGDPLIGGIYGASVDELSLDAVVPQLRTAEREHRSLLLASLAQGRARARAATAGTPAPKGSPFLSFRDGMGSLVDALAGRLAVEPTVRMRLGIGVAEVQRGPGGISVRLSDGGVVRADAIVLAGPATASAAALAGQSGGRRPVRDERVRAVLHQEAVCPLRADLAAQPIRRLAQLHRDPGTRQLPGRRESRDAAAGDHDCHGCPQARLGTCGQSGSASRTSPVQANARAREPPQRSTYEHAPQRPLNWLVSRRDVKTGCSR